MEIEQIKAQSLTFKRARGNLLLVVAFTAINLILMALGSDFYFLFSATIPSFVYTLASELGAGLVGLVIALAILALYLVCYLLSKDRRVFILVALVFFSFDTIFFAFAFYYHLASGEFEVFNLIEVAFYAWILFYLITGTRAWAKLRKVSAEDFQAALQAINGDKAITEKDEERAALEDAAPNTEDDRDNQG